MESIEKSIIDYIQNNIDNFSKRSLRFLAMYFPNAKIRRQCWIKTNVELGEGTYLNPNVTVVDDYLSNETLLTIGKNSSIAPGVIFVSCSFHNNSSKLRTLGVLNNYEKKQKITVGDDVWIGAHVTILPGITIGSHSIIGANSLINIDIPPFSLAYGNPVRIIRDLTKDILK